ncbi:MAG: hypothetical protein KJ893_00595 [Candidatus Omnitrophica bacterium]|nr:hypothetical protein [Candidatus Omnitrophota bacterium]MBU4478329.1 hypothetical protein [Candidatus Omnitrophota bacterium]MCG2704257.1 hypothetical protein [Candidatus Omnitrophota bacterium]
MGLNKAAYKRLGFKITSLLLAVGVWLYIHGIVENMDGSPLAYKDLKSVEIKLMGEPLVLGKNLFSVDLGQSAVDIRIKGPEKEIEKITPLDITAYVDISGLRPGRTYSPVINFITPDNVELVGAPALVRVEIKEKHL